MTGRQARATTGSWETLSQHLRLGIDTKFPERLVVGKGNALYIAGWCYHPNHVIVKLEIMVDGVAYPTKAYGIAMPHVHAAHFPHLDPKGHTYCSGFRAIVPIAECHQEGRVDVCLRAASRHGIISLEKIGELLLEPELVAERSLTIARETGISPLIAICMTTYNPRLDLFTRQIQSIRDQTYPHWICIISDDCSHPNIFEQIQQIIGPDPRFHLSSAPSRLGFYHNFERCLSLVPDAGDFVALSDHDDWWHPDKLEVLLSRFDKDTTLVYSDMNIVDVEGNRIAGKYWTTRPNNWEDLGSLLMANTITGAASLLRRDLLSRLLPFRQKIGEPYHDHWIGCVALAMGPVKYVDRPLYDYVQYEGNVLGHLAPQRRPLAGKFLTLLNAFSVRRAREQAQAVLTRWRATYFFDVLRIQLMARVLELRCGECLSKDKARAVRYIWQADDSIIAVVWLALHGLRNLWRITETMGAEYTMLRGVLWKRFRRWALPAEYSCGGR